MSPDIEGLARALREANLKRRFGEPDEALIEESYHPSTRLAVYGSLAPGEVNHRAVEPIGGTWHRGSVRGVVYRLPWVDGNTYPGIILTESAPDVPVQIFSAGDLPSHWERLDAFEGDNYYRALAVVRAGAELEGVANIYELRRPPDERDTTWH